jgi:hypothetical protein
MRLTCDKATKARHRLAGDVKEHAMNSLVIIFAATVFATVLFAILASVAAPADAKDDERVR